MIKIEANVPLPPASERREGRGLPIYPFKKLAFGESFFVAPEAVEKAKDAAKHYRQRHPGWNFYVKPEDGGVRIWRTG